MSNRKWVCFNCREAVRRPAYAEVVRCPRCAAPCQNIGYRIPLPPKSKVKLWAALHTSVEQDEIARRARLKVAVVAQAHSLEQRIGVIAGRPANPGRLSLLKRLSKKLALLKERPPPGVTGQHEA